MTGLIQHLRGGTASERWEASEKIGQALMHSHPPPALPEELAEALVGALGAAQSSSREDSGIRYWCCRALGDLRVTSQPVVDALASVAAGPDDSAAGFAASSLVEIGVPALPWLLDYLGSNDVAVRRRIARAFSRNPQLGLAAIDALETAILDEDILVAAYACESAAHIGVAAAPMLCRALLKNPTNDRSYRVASAFEKIGNAEFLKDLLLDGSAHVRRAAARALGSATFEREEGAKAIPALGAALKDEDEVVRESAARALEHLGGDPWMPKKPTLNVVKDDLLAATEDENATVRNFAIRCLGFVDADITAVLDCYIKRLADEDDLVKGFAIAGVGQLGRRASKATPLLVAILWHSKENRSDALRALARIGRSASEAAPALIELSKRYEGYDRAELLDALKRIDPDAYDELCENEPRDEMHGDLHEQFEG